MHRGNKGMSNIKKSIFSLIMFMSYCAPALAMTLSNDATAYFTQITAAASKGDVESQVCLGDLYADGIGTSPDFNSAFHWYETAAGNGDLSGKLRVAQAYIYGIGVQKDSAKALQIINDLIRRGYAPAESFMAFLYLGENGVAKDEGKSLELYRKAAAADDYEAELRLGLFYHWGDYVEKNQTEASKWLQRAANHKINCLSSFGTLVNFLINGYIRPLDPKRASVNGAAGNLRIGYLYNNAKAENATVLLSSGDPVEDQAWLDATRAAVLPPWPESYHPGDRKLGFLIPGDDGGLNHDFIVGLRKAIAAAKRMPKEVLLNGTGGISSTNVGFDYLDGQVTNIKIVSSSGDAREDGAAIDAVKNAWFDATPSEYKHKKLHLTVTVDFDYIPPTSEQPHTSP